MSRKLVAGNWKMNLVREEAQWIFSEIYGMVQDEVRPETRVLIFPPFVHIGFLAQLAAADKRIGIGAQNCSEHASGAYTGEVSAAMIRSVGGTHVLVGHSERRTYFNETDAQLLAKVKQALANGLTPVFCFGEQLAERESGAHFNTVKSQLVNGIFSLTEKEFSACILAYEPVWAIGTGKTASKEQAQEMHAFVRDAVAKQYSTIIADATTILYGGSCNEQNAAELFAMPDVDGGLIGGASLKSRSFVNIVKALPH